MIEESLQSQLQDKDYGLAQNVYRQNPNFRIQETLARIGPEGIRVSVKGNKMVDSSLDTAFHTEILLSPRVVFGQVKLDVAKTVVYNGSGLSEFFGSLLAPILNQSIRAAIEKFAARELSANMSAAPPGLRSQHGAPLGIIPANGALDVYF